MTDTAAIPATATPVRKSYSAAKHAKAATPYVIDIDGTEFVTRPGKIPGAVQIDFSGLTYTHDSDAMWRFFRAAFVDENGGFRTDDFDAFHDYLLDPSRDIHTDLLVEIIKDMIEFANGLPTVRSNS